MARKGNIYTARNKENVLKALRDCEGIVYIACKNANVGRNTFYTWLREDEAFRAEVDEINEVVLDKIESVVVNIALAGESQREQLNAAKFMLATKGKHRGFSERTETHVSGELNSKIEVVRAEFPNNGTDQNPPLPPSWEANTSGILPG